MGFSRWEKAFPIRGRQLQRIRPWINHLQDGGLGDEKGAETHYHRGRDLAQVVLQDVADGEGPARF